MDLSASDRRRFFRGMIQSYGRILAATPVDRRATSYAAMCDQCCSWWHAGLYDKIDMVDRLSVVGWNAGISLQETQDMLAGAIARAQAGE